MNTPKIVVLDGYTLNPGDLSWAPLEKLGQLTVYDRTSDKDILQRSQNANILLTNKTPITQQTILSIPNLKYIGALATGYNNIDISTAKMKNIPVCNVPGYSGMSVAQATFALLLEITNQPTLHSQAVKSGAWSKNLDFCFTLSPLMELNGLTFGTIGYGNIAKSAINIAKALGLRILVHTRTKPECQPQDIQFVSLNELLSTSDVVSLHCPLTENTTQIINSKTLSLMKPNAILINTARGQLVNESDLAKFLNEGKIYAAGLDVLAIEPPHKDNPLLSAKNCYITPHNAWATLAARARLLSITTENIQCFLTNKIQNQVNR